MKAVVNWYISPKMGLLCGDVVSDYLKMPDGTLTINKDNIYSFIQDKKIVNASYNKNIIITSFNNDEYILDPNRIDKFFFNKFNENQKQWLLKYGLQKDDLNCIKLGKKK